VNKPGTQGQIVLSERGHPAEGNRRNDKGHTVVDSGNTDVLRVDVDDDGTLIVYGDIDIAGGPILDDALSAAQQTAGPIALDLGNVSFIDSSGLRSLLNASRRASDQTSHVVLRRVGPEVIRLLEITGTTQRFLIESNRD
jgi:anti-sigma B factor antagonist